MHAYFWQNPDLAAEVDTQKQSLWGETSQDSPHIKHWIVFACYCCTSRDPVLNLMWLNKQKYLIIGWKWIKGFFFIIFFTLSISQLCMKPKRPSLITDSSKHTHKQTKMALLLMEWVPWGRRVCEWTLVLK